MWRGTVLSIVSRCRLRQCYMQGTRAGACHRLFVDGRARRQYTGFTASLIICHRFAIDMCAKVTGGWIVSIHHTGGLICAALDTPCSPSA